MAIDFVIPYRLKDDQKIACTYVKPKQPGKFGAAINSSLDYIKKYYKFPIKITITREGIYTIKNEILDESIMPLKECIAKWFMKIPGNGDVSQIQWIIKQHKGRKFCVSVNIVPIIPEYEAYKNAKAMRTDGSKSRRK